MIGVGLRPQSNQGEKTELLQPARERKFSDREDFEMHFSRSWHGRLTKYVMVKIFQS